MKPRELRLLDKLGTEHFHVLIQPIRHDQMVRHTNTVRLHRMALPIVEITNFSYNSNLKQPKWNNTMPFLPTYTTHHSRTIIKVAHSTLRRRQTVARLRRFLLFLYLGRLRHRTQPHQLSAQSTFASKLLLPNPTARCRRPLGCEVCNNKSGMTHAGTWL